MKKKTKLLLVMFLIASLFIASMEHPLRAVYEQEESVAQQTSTEINDTRANGVVTDFSIRWTDTANSQLIIDAYDNSSEYAAKAEMKFSVSAANIATGDIKIKLPAKIYKNREGKLHGRFEIGIVLDNGGNVDYAYEYDVSQNEIIITNTQPITDAHTLMVQISYFDADIDNHEYLSQIVHNSEHYWKAKYEVIQNGETITGESEELSVLHKLSTKLESVFLNMDKRLFAWDDAWGEEPEDADDYFYIRWKVTGSFTIGSGAHSLPIKLTLNSENESGHNGEVVTWEGYYCSDFDSGKSEVINNDLIMYITTPGQNIQCHYRATVIKKYPKSSVEGDNKTIREKVTATVEPYYKEDVYTPIVKSAEKEYVYTDVNFAYPPGNFGLEKDSTAGRAEYDHLYGTINKINLMTSDEEFNLPATYQNIVTIHAGDLTLKDGGDESNFDDYEQKFYETELVDDLLVLGDQRLMPEDYSIPSVNIYAYNHYTVDIDEIYQEEPYLPLGVTDMQPITIYYATDLTGKNWQEAAEVKKVKQEGFGYNYDQYQITYVETGKTETDNYSATIDLPQGAVAVKATVRSKKAKLEFYLHVNVNLKGSQKVKELVKDKSQVSLHNISTLVVKDEDNNWVNANPSYTIGGNLKAIVEARDEEVFGAKTYGQHDAYALYLHEVEQRTNMIKKLYSFEQNEQKEHFVAECIVGAFNGLWNRSNILVQEDYEALGLLEEESTGKIYDLLPLGAYIDETSLKVGYMEPISNNEFIEQEQFKVTIQYKHNWKDSGRTMAIFTIDVPQDYDNRHLCYADEETHYFSGFAVQFNMVYPYDSLIDYGGDIRNLAAYQSKNTLFSGWGDNGATPDFKFGSKEKYWFTDIDEDGKSGDDAPKNTQYAVDEEEITDPIAAQIGFSKSVKNDSDVSYQKATSVLPREHYSYRIRIGNGILNDQAILQSKDMVLFDVLEEAHGLNPYWKGTLESVDTSQLALKNIDAKVYYSTKQNIQLNTDMNGELTEDADITNEKIWSTSMPTDKSSITAIAVDMRNDTNNQEFVLEDKLTLNIIVHMKAPNINIAEYMKKQAKAYNDAWLASFVKLNNNANWTGTTLQCNPTQVDIRNANLGIDKTSDPESGTKEQPTEVHNDDDLTYDVAITNKEMSVDIEDIVMVDEIPKGLEIGFDEIKYYYNNDKQNAKSIHDEDDGLSVVRDQTKQQKLTFTIKRLEANETIHFIIPTKVIATDEAARYENQAVITEVGRSAYEIKSPITYHEKKVEVANFEFLKKNKQDSSVSDAKFVLYEMNCVNNVHDHRNELIEVDKNGDLIQESTCFTKHGEASSGSDGKVTFVGLKTNKAYRLIEYEAPKEYITPKGQWVLAYDQGSKSFKVTGSIGNPPGFEKPDSTWIVRNYTIEELPTTGGRGLTKFMTIGTVVMIVGGYWIYSSRKKRRI